MTVLRARALNAQGQPVAGRTATLELYGANRYQTGYLGSRVNRSIPATSGSDGWMQWTLPDLLRRPGPKGTFWLVTGLESKPVVVATQPTDGTVTLDDRRVGAVGAEGDLVPSPVDTTALAASASGAAGVARAFAGVLATLRRAHRSVCVSLIGDSTGDDHIPGTPSNVDADEWLRVVLRKLAADFPAYTLMERNWNDTVQGYDLPYTLQNGTGNGGGARRAVFTKAAPGQLQFAGATITGDIDVRIKVAPTAWAATGTLVGKWESTGNQRSWLLTINADGTLTFNWSTDGVGNIGGKISTAAVQSVSGVANGQPYWVRATLDVDNGATGNTLTFYTSPDGIAWVQLGAPVVTAGVTSIFAGTGAYMLGSFTSGLSTPFGGSVYWCSVRAGIGNQQSLVPPLPDDWEQASSAPTVSYAGAPVLMLLNGSQSGQNVVYFDNAVRRAILHQRHGQQVVVVSTSHNDGVQTAQTWLSNYAALVNNIKTLLPYVPILCVGQNQVGLGGTFAIDQQGIEMRGARSARVQQFAASQAGVYSFDAWPLVTADDTSDQLHPTTGPGSGSEKWGLALYDWLTR